MLKTNADRLVEILSKEKIKPIKELAAQLNTTKKNIFKIAKYLEEENILKITYHFTGATLKYVEEDNYIFSIEKKEEMISMLHDFKQRNELEKAKNMITELYEYCQKNNDPHLNNMYKEIYTVFTEEFSSVMDVIKSSTHGSLQELDNYLIWNQNIVMQVSIVKNELEPQPNYNISKFSLNNITELILGKIKDSIISSLNYEKVFKASADHQELIKEEFRDNILGELEEIMPDVGTEDRQALVNYILITSLGLGDVEYLLKDENLEEIVINNAYEPLWVYHRKFGWLKTNIIIGDESKIRHFATIGGRVVDKNITNLEPLLDGHLTSGDRFNATLNPITTKGNTITIRKFAEKPWTVVDFIKKGTLDVDSTALIWVAIQYEMSSLIVGGTGSGKTSALNVYSVFIPPSNRVISIEDTRELTLANTLHWVPMQTRSPNPEGKGAVTMLDLIVNALRMRPDRILFGEIRRKEEAETLFEAMHTGHSAIATFHANTAEEAFQRLTSRPIELDPVMLSSLALILVHNRNRRTGQRVLLQIAEVKPNGEFKLVSEYDYASNEMQEVDQFEHLYKNLELFAGLTREQIFDDLEEKKKILQRMTRCNIDDTHNLGVLMSKYYVNKEHFYEELDKLEKGPAKTKKKEGGIINLEEYRKKLLQKRFKKQGEKKEEKEMTTFKNDKILNQPIISKKPEEMAHHNIPDLHQDIAEKPHPVKHVPLQKKADKLHALFHVPLQTPKIATQDTRMELMSKLRKGMDDKPDESTEKPIESEEKKQKPPEKKKQKDNPVKKKMEQLNEKYSNENVDDLFSSIKSTLNELSTKNKK